MNADTHKYEKQCLENKFQFLKESFFSAVKRQGLQFYLFQPQPFYQTHIAHHHAKYQGGYGAVPSYIFADAVYQQHESKS